MLPINQPFDLYPLVSVNLAGHGATNHHNAVVPALHRGQEGTMRNSWKYPQSLLSVSLLEWLLLHQPMLLLLRSLLILLLGSSLILLLLLVWLLMVWLLLGLTQTLNCLVVQLIIGKACTNTAHTLALVPPLASGTQWIVLTTLPTTDSSEIAVLATV